MLPAQALGSLLPTGETELSVELLASSAPGLLQAFGKGTSGWECSFPHSLPLSLLSLPREQEEREGEGGF